MPETAHDSEPPWLSIGRGIVTVRVLAHPRAPRTGIIRIDPRGLVIGLKSAPERGKANAELVETLARLAGVARLAIEVAAGASARQKLIRIATVDPLAMRAKLRALASEAAAQS